MARAPNSQKSWPPPSIALATRVVAAIGAVLTLAVVFYAGDKSSLGMIALGAVFALWAILPYGIGWFGATILQDQFAAGIILLIGLLGVTIFGLWVYYSVFINNPTPDAQDGLILIFVPLYQLGIVVAVRVVAKLVGRWSD